MQRDLTRPIFYGQVADPDRDCVIGKRRQCFYGSLRPNWHLFQCSLLLSATVTMSMLGARQNHRDIFNDRPSAGKRSMPTILVRSATDMVTQIGAGVLSHT